MKLGGLRVCDDLRDELFGGPTLERHGGRPGAFTRVRLDACMMRVPSFCSLKANRAPRMNFPNARAHTALQTPPHIDWDAILAVALEAKAFDMSS